MFFFLQESVVIEKCKLLPIPNPFKDLKFYYLTFLLIWGTLSKEETTKSKEVPV